MIGAGPAGMATALSVGQAGHDVLLLERYPEARPAGNILNLWPPPVKALGLLAPSPAAPASASCPAAVERLANETMMACVSRCRGHRLVLDQQGARAGADAVTPPRSAKITDPERSVISPPVQGAGPGCG